MPTARDTEAALRSLGLSQRQAKKLLAGGWKALAPEAVEEEAQSPENLIDRTGHRSRGQGRRHQATGQVARQGGRRDRAWYKGVTGGYHL